MEEKDAFEKRMRRAVALSGKALPLLQGGAIATITAEELAHVMGISRATFFRHFATKDEAIYYAVMGEAVQFLPHLEDAPADLRDQPLWPVMRRAMAAFERKAALPDFRDRLRLAINIPDIGAHLRLSRRPQQDRLVAELEMRGVSSDTAQLFVTVAMAATDRCLVAWARGEESDLTKALDRAFASLAQGY